MRLVPVCISAVLAGCLAASPAVAVSAASTQQAMTIVDFKFAQPKVRLSVGDTMTWTNNDRAPHDVSGTKAPATFQSPLLMKGDSWRYTFRVPGRYDYICSIHPDMKAVVDVAAVAKPAAAAKTTTVDDLAATTITAKAAVKPAAKKAAERTEYLASTANARELESVRQLGAAAVGVLVLSLLIVGLQGSSTRANAPKPEWVGAGESRAASARPRSERRRSPLR